MTIIIPNVKFQLPTDRFIVGIEQKLYCDSMPEMLFVPAKLHIDIQSANVITLKEFSVNGICVFNQPIDAFRFCKPHHIFCPIIKHSDRAVFRLHYNGGYVYHHDDGEDCLLPITLIGTRIVE